jgi:S-formylglutathione hydrolase
MVSCEFRFEHWCETFGADDSEPQALEEAAKQNGRGKDEVEVRMQEGFDHSYYFISTFTPEHVAFHAKYLKA